MVMWSYFLRSYFILKSQISDECVIVPLSPFECIGEVSSK